MSVDTRVPAVVAPTSRPDRALVSDRPEGHRLPARGLHPAAVQVLEPRWRNRQRDATGYRWPATAVRRRPLEHVAAAALGVDARRRPGRRLPRSVAASGETASMRPAARPDETERARPDSELGTDGTPGR